MLPLIAGNVFATVIVYLAGALVVRALLAVGIGIAVFIGMDTLMDSIQSNLLSYMDDAGSLYSISTSFMSLLQIDVFINMVFSAYVIKLTIIAPSGILKRFYIG